VARGIDRQVRAEGGSDANVNPVEAVEQLLVELFTLDETVQPGRGRCDDPHRRRVMSGLFKEPVGEDGLRARPQTLDAGDDNRGALERLVLKQGVQRLEVGRGASGYQGGDRPLPSAAAPVDHAGHPLGDVLGAADEHRFLEGDRALNVPFQTWQKIRVAA
jgi:hypothetical protein